MSVNLNENIYFELRAVAEALDKAGVPFSIIGGWAVAFHGHVRFTEDIDLQIDRADIDRIRPVLKQCGFLIDNGWIPLPSQGIEFYRMGKILDKEVLVIDLQPVEPTSKPWTDKRLFEWRGIKACVISLDDLIEMKSRSQRGKDRNDVEELERIRSLRQHGPRSD